MRGKNLSVITTSIIFIIFITNSVLAAPDIQIVSPQAVTYDSTKILVNVTSNETVNFFIKNTKNSYNGRSLRANNDVLAENVTNFQSFIYIKQGSYNFTIWANNSNGIAEKSIVFSTTAHNPIQITDCGHLYSSNAEYVLVNDISPSSSSSGCLYIDELRNVSLNLNGNTITAGGYTGLSVRGSSDADVFNGSITGSATATYTGWSIPWILVVEGTTLRFKDLDISGLVGITTFSLSNTIFDNVSVNSSVGLWFESLDNVYFKNSSFIWNGITSERNSPPTSAFWSWASHAEIYLENVTIDEAFPDYEFYLEGSYTDFFLRSSDINMSKIYYPDWVTDTRFFDQHLIIIDILDQFNISGACSVRVLDNEILPRKEWDAEMYMNANPTGKLFVPTGETGRGETWLTEKLTVAKSSSPVEITEYDFSPYDLTTRGWGSDTYSFTSLNLTGVNSTIYVNFKITTAAGGEELPECTIQQMFDLNNDNSVNIVDAILILRHITGKSVETGEPKNCEAGSFFALP